MRTDRNISTIAGALGSERHADANLAGSPADVVDDGSVQPDAGNHERQRRERGAESGQCDLLADGLVDVRRLRDDIGHRQSVVELIATSAIRTSDLTTGQWREAFRADLGSLTERRGEGIAFAPDGTVILVGEGGFSGPGTFAWLQCARKE
jgi:hypothetical protein